jgi:hypothetical protein
MGGVGKVKGQRTATSWFGYRYVRDRSGHTICHTNNIICRLFAEKFSNLSIDSEGVLSMMSKHPQYGCVSQIKDQLGPVCKINDIVTKYYTPWKLIIYSLHVE